MSTYNTFGKNISLPPIEEFNEHFPKRGLLVCYYIVSRI